MATRQKKTAQVPDFERSAELKRLFLEKSDQWCRKTRLGLSELAERCGVSLQYLSHVGRYGRVPSKPILTLLAFNLDANDPGQFFRAAGIREAWPYEAGIGLRPRSASDSGLLSVNLDMNGFASAIREIVRSEIQPKRFEDLLGRRPLRVGINRGQFFLFDGKDRATPEGFFPELVRTLALSLRCEVEFIEVPHNDFMRRLEDGSIDCYGPVYRTGPRIGHGLYSDPFCHVSIAALARTRTVSSLDDLPLPKRVSDLRKRDYIIAVHRESMAHHFAETVLGVPTSRILTCELPEEAVERIVLASLPRPAHLMLTDSPFAAKIHREHPDTAAIISFEGDSEAQPFEDTVAIRSDWPAFLNVVNESIDFLRRNGALARLYDRTVRDGSSRGIVCRS